MGRFKQDKITEEINIANGIVKTHMSIQQIISQIHTIRFNYIVNLEAVIAYKRLLGLDTSGLENDIKELQNRIVYLDGLKEEWHKKIV